MKFHSIKMKNFGVFTEDKIDFAHRKGSRRIVTFVIGANGTGKTTLANAMRWCLFGETGFSDQNSIAAIEALRSVDIGEAVDVEVCLELQHQEMQYTFIRRMKFERTSDNFDGRAICRARPESLEFSCTSSTNDGVSSSTVQGFNSVDKPVDAIVERICPKRLRPFIFFNGERIGALAHNFEQGASGAASETIRTAVKILLGLEAFRNGAMHLDERIPSGHGIQVVKRKFEVELAALSNEKVAENPVKIARLEDEIGDLNREKLRLQELLVACQGEIEELKVTIRENQEAKKLLEERDLLRVKIDSAKDHQREIYKEMLERFNLAVKVVAAKSTVMKALDAVQAVSPAEEAIPYIRAETIDALLRRGRCLCGEPIQPGSKQESELLKLKEKLPPYSIANSIGAFVKSCRDMYSQTGVDGLAEKITDYSIKVMDDEDTIKLAEQKIENIALQLEDDEGFGSRIAVAERLCKQKEKEVKDLEAEITRIGVRIEDKSIEIDHLSRELIQDRKNEADKAFYRRCLSYTHAVADVLRANYSQNEAKVVERLDQKVKETFKFLGLRKEIPSISKDYVFTCTEANGVPTRLSESLSFIAALSTITAIIQLGKELVSEDSSLSSTVIDAVPLVMDAPLSTFDTQRIEAFGGRMPDIVDQLIVFTKDTEGDIVRPIMQDRIGRAYKIVADSETRSHFEPFEE